MPLARMADLDRENSLSCCYAFMLLRYLDAYAVRTPFPLRYQGLLYRHNSSCRPLCGKSRLVQVSARCSYCLYIGSAVDRRYGSPDGCAHSPERDDFCRTVDGRTNYAC